MLENSVIKTVASHKKHDLYMHGDHKPQGVYLKQIEKFENSLCIYSYEKYLKLIKVPLSVLIA